MTTRTHLPTTLLLDCGNSRLKWGIYSDAHWSAQGELPLNALHNLPLELSNHPAAANAFFSNVAGEGVGEQIRLLLNQAGISLTQIRAQTVQCGVKNGYKKPEQLGTDRWAALIAAHHLHDGACVVVSAGTATTVDALSGEGGFLGGLILPGTRLMKESLARQTAGLPLADGEWSAFPSNTADAIASGCLEAQAGAILRMVEKLSREVGEPVSCILSGGAAHALETLLSCPVRRIENLVLEGLLCIALDQIKAT